MKRYTLFIFPLVVILITALFIINRPNNSKIDTKDGKNLILCENRSTDDIKNKAEAIERDLSTYTTTTKDILGKSTEGGQQTNYLLDGKPKLIKQLFFSETGKSEIQYFLENNKVLYFTKTNSIYALPLSQDASGKVTSLEFNEFYLNGDQKLCTWYSNNMLQENTQSAQDTVNYLVSDL